MDFRLSLKKTKEDKLFLMTLFDFRSEEELVVHWDEHAATNRPILGFYFTSRKLLRRKTSSSTYTNKAYIYREIHHWFITSAMIWNWIHIGSHFAMLEFKLQGCYLYTNQVWFKILQLLFIFGQFPSQLQMFGYFLEETPQLWYYAQNNTLMGV